MPHSPALVPVGINGLSLPSAIFTYLFKSVVKFRLKGRFLS